MQSDQKISVVIVNWNTRQLLLDCIASLKATTNRRDIEIIVVDNASADGSQQALRETYSDVKLICNDDNLGFAKANNLGFAAAHGEAFCMVNTDVIALDGVLDRLWDYLETHAAVGMVGPRTLNRDLEVRQNCRSFPDLGNALGDYLWLKRLPGRPISGRALPRETYAYTHDAEVLSGCFLMVRRKAVEEVGGLDEDFFFYGEDTDWCKRFFDANWGIVYYPRAEAIHFGGGSTAAYPVKYYLTMEKADLLYWAKHAPPARRAAYVAIKVLHHVVSLPGWLLIWLTKPARRSQAALKVRGHLINTVWLLTRRSLV